MNRPYFRLLFLLITLGMWGAVPTYAVETQQDTTVEGYPVYRNVDITIDYAWTDMERFENITAIVQMEGRKSVAVVLEMKDGTRYEIHLIDEVTVKIYDHQSGKLLRVLGNPRAT